MRRLLDQMIADPYVPHVARLPTLFVASIPQIIDFFGDILLPTVWPVVQVDNRMPPRHKQ